MLRKEELMQFKVQQVGTLMDFTTWQRAIGTKWVLLEYERLKDVIVIMKLGKDWLHWVTLKRENSIYDEVFAPVARIEAIRLFLAYASFKDFVVYQMDVKSVFLYGKIEEEVYVCQPPWFEDPEFLTEFIRVKSDILLVQELRVTQKDDGIFISQDKYVDEILKKFGFSTIKTASTPMETSKPLLKDAEAEDVMLIYIDPMIAQKGIPQQSCQFLGADCFMAMQEANYRLPTHPTEEEYVVLCSLLCQVLLVPNSNAWIYGYNFVIPRFQ
ncbi:copia protein [Tanacetum coccineum]